MPIGATHPSFCREYLFVDSYQQVNTPAGSRVNKVLIRYFIAYIRLFFNATSYLCKDEHTGTALQPHSYRRYP